MKKHTRKITSIALGTITVSSIALTLHFYANFQEVSQSHEKLDAKYKTVLLENEDIRNTNDLLLEKNTALESKVTNVSGLLEQSEMEIERRQEEIDKLQKEKQSLQKQVANLKK